MFSGMLLDKIENMTADKKTIYFLHGTGGHPRNFWFPNVASHAKELGYDNVIPQFPDPDDANLVQWLEYFEKNYSPKENDLLIGHSAGVPNALNILQTSSVKFSKAILVAGFIDQLPHQGDDHPTLFKNQKWDKIKSSCDEFIFIHSDNDPWGCDHKQGEKLRSYLGGTLIVKTGEGHFGSVMFEQPYSDFPLVEYFLEQ